MQSTPPRTATALLSTLVAFALASAALVVRAADHADSPDTDQNNLDINDIYAFNVGEDVAFVMTVAPLLTPGEITENAALNPRGLYEFKLDAQRDGIPEAVIQVATAGVGSGQTVTYRGPVKPETTGAAGTAGTGPTSRVIPGPSIRAALGEVATGAGMTAWAGPSDDPFYVDLFGDMSLTSVLNAAYGAALGMPVGNPDEQTLAFSDPAQDDLAGLNTLSIVVQLPRARVADALGIAPDGTFFVWGTTSER